jgi:HAE1 family hydrophobic/amphiphilic exporter-1
VIHALVFGAVLTVFVVYVFLNSWRSTLITALSLPTSVMAAFIAVWLCGFSLNFMSLLGLSLAIGVLIDDAIVVRENIVRHMERGEDRRTAALKGTAEIGMAVAATTFSSWPCLCRWPSCRVSGEWFRPFRPDGGGLGAGEPVHQLHAGPHAVGLLGRPARANT